MSRLGQQKEYQVVKLYDSDEIDADTGKQSVPDGDYFLLYDDKTNPKGLYLAVKPKGESAYTPYNIFDQNNNSHDRNKITNFRTISEITSFAENEDSTANFSLEDTSQNDYGFKNATINYGEELFFAVQESINPYSNPVVVPRATPVPAPRATPIAKPVPAPRAKTVVVQPAGPVSPPIPASRLMTATSSPRVTRDNDSANGKTGVLRSEAYDSARNALGLGASNNDLAAAKFRNNERAKRIEQLKPSAQNVADAMRLLMKAHRDAQKLWPRGKGASTRNEWRRQAFRILGVDENSTNLMADIKSKIGHLQNIRSELNAHYNGRHPSQSAINSRIFQASQLFEMIISGKNEVFSNELGANDSRKSAAVYDVIKAGNVIESERRRFNGRTARLGVAPSLVQPFNASPPPAGAFASSRSPARAFASSPASAGSAPRAGNNPSTTRVRSAGQKPDTPEAFLTRIQNELPIMQGAQVIAAKQSQDANRRINQQEISGGAAFDDWLQNSPQVTRESMQERRDFFNRNSALIGQNPQENRQLREMFGELSGIVNYCCNPNYITESDSAVGNIANAFRGYFQGVNLSISTEICRKFLDHEIQKTALGSDKMSDLLICQDSLNNGLLESKVSVARPASIQKPKRSAPAASLPGAIYNQSSSSEEEDDIYGSLDALIQGFKKTGIKHVFFDLDDTLIEHAIMDMSFMEDIFGEGVKQYTASSNPASYAHPDRQDFYRNPQKRDDIAKRVTNPNLVSNFMKDLADEGIKVHISTLNSSTLAKVLCEEHDWPVSSISAADGQIDDFKKNPHTLDTSVKTERSQNGARKIEATANIVGGEQNLRQVAFFDDDFSKFSPTCDYLESKGAMCFMKSEKEGVRFDSNHPDFKSEIETVTAELGSRGHGSRNLTPSSMLTRSEHVRLQNIPVRQAGNAWG